MEMSKYAPGTFCWVELATSDEAGAKKFYSALFGWEYLENPISDGMNYVMCRLRGKDVAALYRMMPEMQQQGMPPNWMSYVAVADVDETAKKAQAAGATIMQPPMDVMEHGRMTVLQDPTGAVVSAWQAKQHIGATLVNVPGAFCWNELMTRDLAKAEAFYQQVFGWTTKHSDMGAMGTYVSLMVGDRPNGGMMKLPEQAGPVPPYWGVYFTVVDCDASVKKAQELGAKVVVPPMDIPDTGRFATLMDPQGAVFSIIKLTLPS
jgi:uncharacterized protein